MGLGGVGITLQDLVQLYSGIARLGTTKPLREIVWKDDVREPLRLMDQVAAWQVGNVLIGTPPPENAPHNRIAFKTGTSYCYRDAWSVGFDGRITICVWVGRPDGAPVPGLVGRTAAAPILFDAFARTGKIAGRRCPKAPKGTLVASQYQTAVGRCAGFRPLGELVEPAANRRCVIQFPLNGSRIDAHSAGETRVFLAAGKSRRRRVADDHAGETASPSAKSTAAASAWSIRPGRALSASPCRTPRVRRTQLWSEFNRDRLTVVAMAVSAYAEPMAETYARPRFGEPREPKNRLIPAACW